MVAVELVGVDQAISSDAVIQTSAVHRIMKQAMDGAYVDRDGRGFSQLVKREIGSQLTSSRLNVARCCEPESPSAAIHRDRRQLLPC